MWPVQQRQATHRISRCTVIGNSNPTCDYCHARADAWHYSTVQHRYYSRTLKTWSRKPDLLWASCWNHINGADTIRTEDAQ